MTVLGRLHTYTGRVLAGILLKLLLQPDIELAPTPRRTLNLHSPFRHHLIKRKNQWQRLQSPLNRALDQ